MENKITLTIATIQQKVNNFEYLVIDLFTKKEYSMSLRGKQRLCFINLKIGQELYVKYSTLSEDQCRWVTSTEIKMDESGQLIQQKHEVEEKREKLGL